MLAEIDDRRRHHGLRRGRFLREDLEGGEQPEEEQGESEEGRAAIRQHGGFLDARREKGSGKGGIVCGPVPGGNKAPGRELAPAAA